MKIGFTLTRPTCHVTAMAFSEVLSACHATEKNSFVIFAVSYEWDGGDLMSVFTIDKNPVSSWLITIDVSVTLLLNWLANELNTLTVFLTKFASISIIRVWLNSLVMFSIYLTYLLLRIFYLTTKEIIDILFEWIDHN